MLFLSSQVVPRAACDLAQVHEGAWDGLVSAAHGLGADVVGRPEVEPLVRLFRVRTSLAVSTAFLDSLSSALACAHVLLVDVTIFPDRLLVAGRVTATEDKETLWAGVAEERLPRELATGEDRTTASWAAVIGAACRRLMEQREGAAATAATTHLYLLPVRMAGLDESLAGLVEQCLLRSLIGRQWRIEDPGVTFSRLSAAGIDPHHLDPRARPELTGGRPDFLVIGEVATYEDHPVAAVQTDEELPALAESLLPLFSVSVRWIAGQTGDVTFAATSYVGDGKARGLFGVPKNPSPVRRVQRTTDQLVHAAQQKG